MFKHYITLAFRNLQRNKLQSLFSIVGLAVAFFCFGICMYFVHGWIEMDQYYANHERVMTFRQNHVMSGVRVQFFDELEQQFPEIESICRLDNRGRTMYYLSSQQPMTAHVDSAWYFMADKDVAVMLNVFECDTTLRHIFTPRLVAGSWQAAEAEPNSFLLTESFARRQFGSPEQAIGAQFVASGRGRCSPEGNPLAVYTVRAVVEDLAYNNTIQPFLDLSTWVMNDTEGKLFGDNQYEHIYESRILLRESVNPEQFAAHVDAARILMSEHTDQDGNRWYLSADKPFDMKRQFDNLGIFLLVMLCIAAPGLLILLSALSNFFHLLLSSIMMRRREYTLRRAHGAHTLDLWRMVSTQVVITMLLVGAVSMIIVELCAPLLHIDLDGLNQFCFDKGVMLRHTAQHLFVLLFIGFGVAWLAVARIRRDSLQEAMKTSTGRRPGRHLWRNVLMGWQMLIGLLFITLLTALILQIRTNDRAQLPWLSEQEKRDIIELPMNDSFASQDREIVLSEIRAIPSVKEVVVNGNFSRNFELPEWASFRILNPEGDTLTINQAECDPDWFAFLHIPLFEGHWPEHPNEVLIDEMAARVHGLHVGDQIDLLPDKNGSRFVDTEADGITFLRYATITGIIDDFIFKSHINASGPNQGMKGRGGLYLCMPFCHGYYVCKSYPGQMETMQRDLTQYIRKHTFHLRDARGEQVPMDWSGITKLTIPTLYDALRERNKMERQFLGLFWLFTSIALVITLLGIYSAITMDTTARRKEMAIRKINGGKARHIALRFARLYIIIIGVAAAIAFPLTYILFDLIASVGYRETFHFGFLFYAGIFLLMILFVGLTIGAKVWQISYENPAKIVKSE